MHIVVVPMLTALPSQVSLYFCDWARLNTRQEVEMRDPFTYNLVIQCL